MIATSPSMTVLSLLEITGFSHIVPFWILSISSSQREVQNSNAAAPILLFWLKDAVPVILHTSSK